LEAITIIYCNEQVRIGGTDNPNNVAVLDLNATDATNTGTLGFALPRVSLASATAQLNGVTPLNGMLVYNTNATLGVCIYLSLRMIYGIIEILSALRPIEDIRHICNFSTLLYAMTAIGPYLLHPMYRARNFQLYTKW
jgi:hypothetical protein